jgi:hypothetical protein
MSDALALLASLVLDDGRRWAEAATTWQRSDAAAVLEPIGDAPTLHWLGRPKGGSKSTDLAGMSLAWLVEQAPAMAEGFAVAADEEQSNRLLDKARGFIARTSALRDVVRVEAKRIVNLKTQARVVALAADVAGSEGLLTPWIVVDELPNWADTSSAKAMWTSVFSALPKWRGCRLVCIGHAGDPSHWSYRILERAKVSGRWRVVEVPGPLPWVSGDDLEEQRFQLLPSQFEQRHLNRWVGSEDRLSTVEDVRACVVLDGPLVWDERWRYVVACDLGLKADRTAAMVLHFELDVVMPAESVDDGGAPADRRIGGRVVLDRMQVWEGSRAEPVRLGVVEEWLEQAARAFVAPIVLDPWQSAGMAQRLEARGLAVEEFTFSQSSVGRLAVTLYRLLRERALALPDDELLVDELSTVRLRQTGPGTFRLDHVSGRHDDMAVTLAMGSHWLLNAPPPAPPDRLVFFDPVSGDLVGDVDEVGRFEISPF